MHATGARIGEDAEIGSFSILGPGSDVPSGARVGPHSTLGSEAGGQALGREVACAAWR